MKLTDKHVRERHLNAIIESCELLEAVFMKSELLFKVGARS
jgi:hypothetical protein